MPSVAETALFVARPDAEAGRPVPSPQGAEPTQGPESSRTGPAAGGLDAGRAGAVAFALALAQQHEDRPRHDLHLQRWPSGTAAWWECALTVAPAAFVPAARPKITRINTIES